MRNAGITAVVIILTAYAASSAEKAVKAGGRAGIKTPGIQIPFNSLKSDAEIAADKPEWLFFSEALWAPRKDSLDRIDPKSNQAKEPVAGLAKPCGGMTAGFGSVWTPLCGSGSLARIDAKTFQVTATIETGVSATKGVIASSDDSIWLLTDDKTTLARIDPDQNSVVAEMRLAAGCHSLLFAEKSLWLACPEKSKVLRINPATNLIEKQIEVPTRPEALTAGEGSIWVLCRKDGKVARIDAKTNAVSKTIELDVPDAEGGIAFGDGSVWVSLVGFPVIRIDPKQDAVAQEFYGLGGGVIAVSPGGVWLSNLGNGGILRVDPKRILTTIAE